MADSDVTPQSREGTPAGPAWLPLLDRCARALQRELQSRQPGVYQLVRPDRDQSVNGVPDDQMEWIEQPFALDPEVARAERVACLRPGEPMWTRLGDLLQHRLMPLDAEPVQQVISVHELSTHLFAQYQVHGGHMHLSGCNLEDRPLLQLAYVDEVNGRPTDCRQLTFGSDGQPLDASCRQQLAVDQLAAFGGKPPRLAADVLDHWISVARHHANRDDQKPWAVTLVWCKYASGRLTFSIGSRSVEVPFSGWAQLLANRQVLPPPYTCPHTGLSDYQLAATDDGRITVLPAIAGCTESGRRVLKTELEQCQSTSAWVLPEFLASCPASGHRVLERTLQRCSQCHQRVSPPMLDRGQCRVCRNLVRTPVDDPVLARLLQQYPGLRSFSRWKRAAGADYHVALAQSTIRQLLLVCATDSVQLLHSAVGNRWSRHWSPLSEQQRAIWLSPGPCADSLEAGPATGDP